MGMLAGARVVVTGGAGNVGSHLVDAALAAGAREVVALDALVRGVPENLAQALGSGRARLVEIDIRDREAVEANVAARTSCSIRRRSAGRDARSIRASARRSWSTGRSTCSRRRRT